MCPFLLCDEVHISLKCNILITLLTFQVQRLKTDLGVVQSNLTVMSDMMSQLDPSTAKCADIELLQVLTTNVYKN